MRMEARCGRWRCRIVCALVTLTAALVYAYNWHVDLYQSQRYHSTWESLDARPLPSWYDEAKLGIFIHWGVYSVPSYGLGDRGAAGEWFWWNWKGTNQPQHAKFMKENYSPGFTYTDFAPLFTAKLFDPYKWAELFKDSGAKYVVFTSKHHDGYTNWPSTLSPKWNSLDVGPHRDVVGDLAAAVRKTDLRFGLYYSLMEWFNPMYVADNASYFKTSDFVNKKILPELHDIVNTYKPEVIWSDGDWFASDQYWQSTSFLAWLYNDSPVKDTVVTNDRWGKEAWCKHGGFLTCSDRYTPSTTGARKWENCMTIDRLSWGYRHNADPSDYLSIEEIIQTFVKTISYGGNMLMNVGPDKDGTIPLIYQERLKQMGRWLSAAGEAVYATVPWKHQHDILTKEVWYTSKDHYLVYAFLFTWPSSGYLQLGSSVASSPLSKISLVGMNISLRWETSKPSGIIVDLYDIERPRISHNWVWVLRLEGFY